MVTHLLYSWCRSFCEAEQHGASTIEFLLYPDQFFIRISAFAIGSGQAQLGKIDFGQQGEGFLQESLTELVEDLFFQNVDRTSLRDVQADSLLLPRRIIRPTAYAFT